MYQLVFILTLAILSYVPKWTNAAGDGVPATDVTFEKYVSLGCWKDEPYDGRRNFPDLEGKYPILDGPYQTRKDAVQKCFQVALENEFPLFALLDGGQCFGTVDAKVSYKTRGISHGRSNDCSIGKGGPMANDIYAIGPLEKCLYLFHKSYKRFLPEGKKSFATEHATNSDNRTALHIAARYGDGECVQILYESGANIEAVDKDGKTPLQLAQWKTTDCDGDCVGCDAVKALVAAHAKTVHMPKTEVARVKACAASETSQTHSQGNGPQTGAQKKELPFEPLGCWRDTIPRVILTVENDADVSDQCRGRCRVLIGSYLTRENKVQKCYEAAKHLGFEVFAVQDGGQCMSSAAATTEYNKNGKSNKCGENGTGGPMANSVYRIKTA